MKLATVFFLLILSLPHANAQSPDEMFDKANKRYQEGQYADAATGYESILQNGLVSETLYFNLGNAYYKLGRIPDAIVSYERARKLDPSDEDLAHNLKLANLSIADRIDATPHLFIWDWWDGIKNSFSFPGITWMTYLAYLLSFVFLSLFFAGRSYKLRRLGLYGTFGSAGLFLVLLLLFFVKLSDATTYDEAIIMSSVVSIKNSPDQNSTDAFVLHSGVKVKITEQVGEWVQIRLADGKVGWMPLKGLELI
jgi:tetratricopeptide (TPR) repeat protein